MSWQPPLLPHVSIQSQKFEIWHRSRSLHEQSIITQDNPYIPTSLSTTGMRGRTSAEHAINSKQQGTEICEGNKMWNKIWHSSEGDGRRAAGGRASGEEQQEQLWPCPTSGVSAGFYFRWHGMKKLGYGQRWVSKNFFKINMEDKIGEELSDRKARELFKKGKERCWFKFLICFSLSKSILNSNKLNSFLPGCVCFAHNTN